jgi:phenylpyruvate tautomerase PptA (4-oxalocrotonate tautomerase family)
MPLWKIYHPVGAYTDEDKQEFARCITSIYRQLPKFYVGVVFQEVAPNSFYLGGEQAGDFVRIWVDHIARTFPNEEIKVRFLEACDRLFAPFTSKRGLRWELHVDETDFNTWSIDGMRPPPPDSVAEQRWKTENRSSPYTPEEAVPA